MPKSAISTCFICLSSLFSVATAQGILSANKGPYFVYSVPITITLTGQHPSAHFIDFFVVDSTGAQRDSSIDSNGGNSSRSWTYNVGNLQPGDTFIAVFYDDQRDEIDRVSYPVYVRKPSWLSLPGSYIQLLRENGNSLSLALVFNLSSILENATSIPGAIRGVGGRSFAVRGGQLRIEANFDMNTGNVQVTTSQPLFTLVSGVLGESHSSQGSLPANITLDAHLNPIVEASHLFDIAHWERTIRLKEVPLIGIGIIGVNLSTSIGFGIEGRGRMRLVTGIQNGRWGFYETAQGERTEIAARLRGYGFGRGELKGRLLLWSTTLARGEIRGELEVGGTASYYTGTGLSTTFGGRFRVEAEGQILGVEARWSYAPNSWGDPLPLLRRGSSMIDYFEHPLLTAKTYQTSGFLSDEWPMPKIATRDTHTILVWRDQLSSQGDDRLLLSYYSPSSHSLSAPLMIRQTSGYLSSPSVTILPSGEVVVAWQEVPSANPQAPLENSLSQTQVYLALVNPRQGGVLSTVQVSPPAGASGAFEPAIFWGEGTTGLLVWESIINGKAQLYSAILSRSSNSLILGSPTLIPGQSNTTYQPHVVFYSADSAYAVWLQSTDASDYENMAFYSVWNGSAWSQPDTLVWMGPGTSITSLSIDEKGEYGAIALTYEYPHSSDPNSLDDDEIVSGFFVAHWRGNGSLTYYQKEDTTNLIYEKVQVTVSPTGYVTLLMRAKDRNELEDKEGEVEVWVADISQPNPSWHFIGYSPYVSDSMHFVWDMTAQFGKAIGNQTALFILSEEIDSAGRTQPAYGIRLGAPDLHLVLRGVLISRTSTGFSLAPVQNPTTTSISEFYEKERFLVKLQPLYPNPTDGFCVLPVSLLEKASVKVEVCDAQGAYLLTVLDRELSPGKYEVELQLKNMPSGIYFVITSINGRRYAQRLLLY